MRFFDFSSWQSVLMTLIGIGLFTLITMGVRVMMMLTIQQRQQRMNRQINERLRTLMAAYKVLGGSFTGKLTVDPRSARAYQTARRSAGPEPEGAAATGTGTGTLIEGDTITTERVTLPSEPGREPPSFVIERRIQMRDAVEAALSDVLLLGTEEQVRLAAQAAAELAAGHPVHTADLVVSLRQYIRKALALELIGPELVIPAQGPTRPAQSQGRGGREGGRDAAREGREGAGGGGMAGVGGGMMGLGMGMGLRGSRDDGAT